MVDAAFVRLAERHGHLQCPDRQIPLYAIADRPTDYPPGMQIEDDSQGEPTFTRPDITDVACPFPVRTGCREVPVQKVRRDVEGVGAVGAVGELIPRINS